MSLSIYQIKLLEITTKAKTTSFTASKTTTTLTSYKLMQKESDILEVGLYYLIPPGKYNKTDVFSNFEKIYHLKWKE